MSERQIICSTCRIQFPDIDPYKLHLTTEFHTYNMKRKMAGLDPITEEIFHQKKSRLLGYIAERVHLGFLCLYCSKQFTNGRSCQQHMMDKGHCFLNQDDEEEFEEFYDFSKTYENHPLAIKIYAQK